MRPTSPRIALLCLAAVLALVAIPTLSFGSSSGSGPAGSPPARRAIKAKKRCHRVRVHGHKRRVCKKPKRHLPVGVPPQAPPPPVVTGGSGSGGGPSGGGSGPGGGGGEYPEEPGGGGGATLYETVDLISDPGFEDPGHPTGCFAPFNANDGSVAGDADTPLVGANSLSLAVSPFGRVGCIHEYGFEEGPIGKTVTVEGKLRIDSPADGSGGGLEVCAVLYFEGDQQDFKKCHTYHAGDPDTDPVRLVFDAEGKRLARVFFQLDAISTPIEATLDEAHLYVEQVTDSDGPRGGGGSGGGGGGGGGGSSVGRFAAMVSPTDGETFTTPLNLRLTGIGHDPNIFTNVPEPGKGTNAAEVQFLLDGAPIGDPVTGAEAEYHVFKTFADNLDVSPGQHTVSARATYENPPLVLESPPVTITVQAPPAYAQTVDLSDDVELGPNQSYELVGAPGARIKLNGNGHRIVSSGSTGTSGHLKLKYVDVYNLGSEADTAAPGIDVTTTGSTGSVEIENSVFDSSDPVRLRLDGSTTASIRGNLFRSNVRTPIGQLPRDEPGAHTVAGIQVFGTSAAAKTFAGNNVGAAPVLFQHVNHWTIGGPTDADSNVLIGPRASFEVLESADVTVEGNFLDHVYYGGWSQGQLLELFDTSPITVEHNVLVDSSWPVRGIAGEFAYNLVAEAGHEWMVPADGAYVHHNVFVGGDNDSGGIRGVYPISARIDNNTFDGLLGGLVRAGIVWENGETTLKSNAFVRFPTWAGAVVEREGGTIEAEYNGFFNPLTTNYLGGVTSAHDLNGGTSTDPMFAGPMPTTTFEGDKVAVWQRQLPVSQILADYRARYTPTPGSPYIDAGDPAGGAGNDVGAVGAGTPNPLDLFGKFSQ
jgi:hypothetical protein